MGVIALSNVQSDYFSNIWNAEVQRTDDMKYETSDVGWTMEDLNHANKKKGSEMSTACRYIYITHSSNKSL